MPPRSNNLIDLYRYQCGISEVPDEYHLWCCLSMIAAIANDHVWMTKFGEPIYPNLYVMLIGPSGIGKGIAINKALKFVTPHSKTVNIYRGKVTGAALGEEFKRVSKGATSEGKKKIFHRPSIFLITPELSMSVGTGSLADDFVKRMTELFTNDDYPFREATVTRGAMVFRAPIVNWLSGSTTDWLVDSIPRKDVKSGFFARCIAVPVNYDFSVRISKPRLPKDVDRVRNNIRIRLKNMSHLQGEMKYTRKAARLQDQWYQTRPAPNSEEMVPAWQRADDLVLKIAMCLSLAERYPDMLVHSHHFSAARAMISSIHNRLPDLITSVSQTKETESVRQTEIILKEVKRIPHSALLKKLCNRGVSAAGLKEAISTLSQRNDIGVERSRSGGAIYRWLN